MSADSPSCTRCNGCGRIADSADGEAWTCWTSLPAHSAIAVIAGIVKPVPCPECLGTRDPKVGDAVRYLVSKGFTAEDFAKHLAERSKVKP